MKFEKISKYCAKMIFICSLIFLFLIKFRFSKEDPISEILTKRYGQQGLKIFRETEKVDFKLKKIKCDIEFLKTCISNNLQPDFVKFLIVQQKTPFSSSVPKICKRTAGKRTSTPSVSRKSID